MKRTKVQSIARRDLLVWAGAFFGVLYQSSSVARDYFRRDVHTTISIRIDSSYSVPSITVYSSLSNMVNWSALKKHCPEFVERLKLENSNIVDGTSFYHWVASKAGHKRIQLDVVQNLTTSQIAKIVYSSEIIYYVQPGNESRGKYPAKSDCRITRYLVYPFVCYTITCPHVINLEELRLRGKNNMVRFRMRQEILDKITFLHILLHKKNTHPLDPGQDLYFTVNPSGGSMYYEFSFRRYKNVLMPKPYSSGCRNYANGSVQCRQHSVHLCMDQKFRKSYNTSYTQSAIDMDGPDVSLREPFIASSERPDEYKKFLRDAFYECFAKNAEPDCVSYTFVTFGKISAFEDNFSMFSLLYPLEPGFTVNCSPKLPLWQAAVLIGSIIGFWFGLHFVGIGKFVVDTVARANLLQFWISSKATNKTGRKLTRRSTLAKRRAFSLNARSMNSRDRLVYLS